MLGKTFHTHVVAWLIAQLLKHLKYIDAIPSIKTLSAGNALLLSGLRTATSSEAADWQHSLGESGAQLLTRHFGRLQSHRGGEVRMVEGPGQGRPPTAQSVDAGFWEWRTCLSAAWRRQGEHINVLEARAVLMTLKWRLRKVANHNVRFLHLVDSGVVMSCLGKGRSSSSRLRPVLLQIGAISVTGQLSPIYLHVRSGRNPADRPSRAVTAKKLKQASRVPPRPRQRAHPLQ